MKRNLLAATLILVLCLGLLALPAGALSASDAAIYLSKVENIDGSSYLVDFDGDGREELVFSEATPDGSYNVHIWQGDKLLGTLTNYYAGTLGDDDILLAAAGGKQYLVHYLYLYRENADEYEFYTVENGQWTQKDTLSSKSDQYTWTDLVYTADEHSALSQIRGGVVEPTVPDVPAAPPGDDLPPAPAEAIATLDNVTYYGERSSISMTRDQATAILEELTTYISKPIGSHYPGADSAHPYAALFDTGSGVPGLFLAKGYCMAGESPSSYNGGVLTTFGEAGVWTFQNGQLTALYPEATDGLALYPACVMVESWGEDGVNQSWVHAMGHGSLPHDPANVLVETVDYYNGNPTTYSVDGVSVSESVYTAFQNAWAGTGLQASARRGGGVEYIISGLGPANEMTAALEDFVAVLDTLAPAEAEETAAPEETPTADPAVSAEPAGDAPAGEDGAFLSPAAVTAIVVLAALAAVGGAAMAVTARRHKSGK